MSSIGVDFSGSAAYLGVVKGHTVQATVSIRLMDSPYTFFHTIQNWLKTVHEEFATEPKLWIEQPFVAGSRFPQVALQMVRTATILEIAALEADLEPCFVHPNTWRKKVYGHGRPDDLKERARNTARDVFGFDTKHKIDHNICEAILIAHYGNIVDE